MARWITKLEPHMAPFAQKLYAEGKNDRQVATFLGVSRTTLSNWMRDGREDTCTNAELVAFVIACDKGRDEFDGDLVECWRDHVKLDSKACLAEMKARFPEEYDREQRTKVDVTVNKGQSLMDLRDATPEQLAALEAAENIKLALAEKKALPSGR